MDAALPTWLYQRIVDDSPEAIVVADTDGLIRLWNHAAEEIFGYASEETVGHSLDLIIPEPQRERHWAGYRAVMDSGQTKYGRDLLAVPAVRKDGARISVEFHVTLLRDDTGRLAGIAALIRDVTAHWQRDRALQQRLRELEASRSSP
ncbi:MAG: PAS domain S-box protein [Chloroflexi bacterium]|nr:PAS domain S-box protein [Chloroflexota bacterium]